MSKTVRVGVVSTSWWADAVLLPSLKSHSLAELVAICGRDKHRAQTMADKYSIPQVFNNDQAMIEQAGLDAIIVATPDDSHHEITMRALNAGLHVMCEKPLALDAREAQQMYDTAQARQVKHMVNFTYRWMPFFRYAHDLIQQGYVGRPYHCVFRYIAGYGRGPDYSWRFDRRHGNGILGDLGAHWIDLARWLLGDIERVSAKLGFFAERLDKTGNLIEPANDSAFVLADFRNGAHGLIEVTAMAHLAEMMMRQQVQIYGEDGSLEIDVPFLENQPRATIRGARSSDGQFQILDVPDVYWGETDRSKAFSVITTQSAGCRLFVDSILENRVVGPTFFDGLKTQQIIEAATEASQTGRSVAIQDLS